MQHKNTYTQTTAQYLYTTSIFFFSYFTIRTKKEQAINFVPEIFYFYDTFYYNKHIIALYKLKFIIKNVLSKLIIMIKLTKCELKIIAGNRGIKNYQNVSEEQLINAILKYDRISKNLSQNGPENIVKMQNLSLNELEQIEKMQNLLKNKLKQIAKTRHIKTSNNTSREELLTALLKSNQSREELRRSEDNNVEIGETQMLFNKLRNNFSKEEIKNIRKKIRFIEIIDEKLKELEQKDSLTKQEKQEKKRYTKKF